MRLGTWMLLGLTGCGRAEPPSTPVDVPDVQWFVADAVILNGGNVNCRMVLLIDGDELGAEPASFPMLDAFIGQAEQTLTRLTFRRTGGTTSIWCDGFKGSPVPEVAIQSVAAR